ncbi:polysaccharide deacetylase family protein [Streptacidiphilus sp. ASG 303]|uniref:polysaccharide deacetylase family protein n=1 Tax=Streptacidiphilus sp. ASG 303 TaxID=2896847 RepID=UPI001E2AA254|nr:polysaccharide deacetylase family protein [Streptacidiphilus sp. ASG 303]MCD0483215.1 polysaccharide deacetylase family protein [Streptacidiphilus sp. ASG 303]
MYHSVAPYEEDPYLLTVSPGRFAAQMRWLHTRGLRGVGVGELLRAAADGRARGLVGLTFDDGYADLLDHVVPVLRARGFTATVYVVAGRLGGDNAWDPDGPRKPLLTADQVREAAAAGVEIGSHGLLHTDLTGLGDDALAAETARSRELLEDVAGVPVTGFCYPYGAVDARAAAAVRAAGYDHACAIAHGPLTGRHALPRTYVGDRDGPLRLHAKRARHLLRDLRGAAGRLRPDGGAGPEGGAR